MISKLKKPVSILLSLIMVFSLFTIVPFTVNAAENGLYVNSVYANTTTSGAGWSFDTQTNTLTLEDYSFTGVGSAPPNDSTVIMYYPQNGTLTIDLKGTNTIVQGNGTNRTWWGIYCRSDLVITGDGTLNISTTDGGYRGAAIYGEKNITITGNCTVNAASGTVTNGPQGHGICHSDNSVLAIGENANVTATGPMGNTVIEATVTSGGTVTYYSSLKEAITAAPNGSTVTLLKDVTETQTAYANNNDTYGGDGNVISGKTITITSNGTGSGRKTVTGSRFDVINGGNVTFTNIIIDGGVADSAHKIINNNNSYSYYFMAVSYGSTLTFDTGATVQNYYANAHGVIDVGNGRRGNIVTSNGSSTINIKDGSEFKNLGANYGVFREDYKSTINMSGGSVTNCTSFANEGVCAYVAQGSAFNMTGGEITGCSPEGSAPGLIFLHTGQANGNNKFTMTGGTISGNTAKLGGTVYSDNVNNTVTVGGSAVATGNTGTQINDGQQGSSNFYLAAGQTMTLVSDNHLSGDSLIGIYSKTAPTDSADVKIATGAVKDDIKHIHSDLPGNAGIVYCDGTKDWIYLNDQFVEVSCHHTSHQNGTVWLSTAVSTYEVTFDTDGGTPATIPAQTVVSNSKATKPADPTKDSYMFDGWYNGDTEFNFDTPITADTNLKAKWSVPVASVTSNGTTTYYSEFSTALTNWVNGSTLTLLANVERNSTINVTGTQTLDLNGHGIKMTAVNQTLFDVTGNLTLNDSDTTKIHKFDPPSGTAGLATLNEASGSLEIHGGYITGFKGNYNCYVIHIPENARCTMNGGNLIGNQGTASGSNCSVVVGANGDFTMNGGAIIYNKSGYWGAAFNGLGVTINGGTIAHNYSAENCGAVHCHYLTMTGGSITDNYAAKTGQVGGITVAKQAYFSGNPIIKNNTNPSGAANSIYTAYSSNTYIAITEPLGENACIGITHNVGVFTASTNTAFNDASKFKSDNVNYKVVKNAGGQLELVYKFFAGHNITLGGDIGVNFYLNPAVLDNYNGTKTVKFTCDGEETTVDVPATPTADGYKVTRNVVAAQMAHTITATLYVAGEPVDTDEYSVREYAEDIYNNPTAYDDKGKPVQLKALAKALLNYGAMAQTVFADYLTDKTPALANTTVGNNGYAAVTADDIAAAIKGSAFKVSDVETALGAKFYTSSLIYLSKNTLRLYFTPTSYPGEIPNSGAYDGNLSGYYYYVDHEDIAAAELDEQQTFNVNGTEFTYSALDYAKAVVESTKMEPEQKNLAKSLFLYNQAANAYF